MEKSIFPTVFPLSYFYLLDFFFWYSIASLDIHVHVQKTALYFLLHGIQQVFILSYKLSLLITVYSLKVHVPVKAISSFVDWSFVVPITCLLLKTCIDIVKEIDIDSSWFYSSLRAYCWAPFFFIHLCNGKYCHLPY